MKPVFHPSDLGWVNLFALFEQLQPSAKVLSLRDVRSWFSHGENPLRPDGTFHMERCRFGRRESSGPRNRERKNEMSWQCRSKDSWIIVVSCWCLELCRSYLKNWWNMMKKVY